MSLTFKDNQIAVISPGSGTTLIQCGLGESLLLPASFVPTRVFETAEGKYTFESGPGTRAVLPLEKGRIANEAAFHYFLRQIYKTITTKMGVAPAVLLLKSPSWTKRQLERLGQHLFEHAGVPALSLISNPVASSFALAAKDCVVVNVGLDKAEVAVLNDFSAPGHLVHTVQGGGAKITQYLASEFGLEEEIAEELKLSGIVEVPAGAHEGPLDVETEEGVVDVAAIVSSGRTHEFIEQREREKSGKADAVKPNIELETNTFVDSHGTTHTIGSNRFKACDDLIDDIVRAVGLLVPRALPRVQPILWQNIIVTGQGALVPGFKQGLIAQLESVYLVANTSIGGTAVQQFGAPDTSTKQTPNEGDAPSQAPTSIKLAQLADHFPEWKNSGWAQTEFLGAQIAAKQSFSSQANYSVSRSDYNEVGPQAVWDL